MWDISPSQPVSRGIFRESRAPGRFTLRSLNAADMENVEVIWAAPVLFVMPKR